jgi:hypothetical protein
MPPASRVAITDFLKVYRFHGVYLAERGEEAVGTCPFCLSEGKFSVRVSTGQWRCLKCNEGEEGDKVNRGGNVATFLRRLHALFDKATSEYPLATERGLLYEETLMHWGGARSTIVDEWVMPGYGTGGKLDNLYAWREASGKYRLLATAGSQHALFGTQRWDKEKEVVYICEGPWDAMALWEILRVTRDNDGQLERTGAEESSLLAQANVIAVPGCNVFSKQWLSLLAGKRVVLLYDNDHPVETPPDSGRFHQPGWNGMRRVAEMLATADKPPADVRVLLWGKDYSGFSPDLADGFDLRDLFKSESTLAKRQDKLAWLLERIAPVPDDWIPGRSRAQVQMGDLKLRPKFCKDWAEVDNAWKIAWSHSPNHQRTLACMLACAASTPLQGWPLWLRIIGPGSCGKTTMAEALAISENCWSESRFTGLHSGWKTDRDGEEDHGLLPKITGKCFIIKEGDTLRTNPSRAKIMGELRDAADGVARAHYGHGVRREYHDSYFTSLLLGTDSIRELDASEVGNRYIDVVVMRHIDREMEKTINRRVSWQAFYSKQTRRDGTAESRMTPEKAEAYKLTAGYLDYLYSNIDKLTSKIEPTDDDAERMDAFGRFVAYMRARPSKVQDENTSREFSARLVEQYAALALCLAAVTNAKSIDDYTTEVVRQSVLDTARGKTFDLCLFLYEQGEMGYEPERLANAIGWDKDKVKEHLRFLRRIDCVETFRRDQGTAKGNLRYRMTDDVYKLWASIVEGVDA